MKYFDLLLVLVATAANAGDMECEKLGKTSIPASWVPEGFCVSLFATDFSNPRGLHALPNGDLLVIESSEGSVNLLWQGKGGSNRVVLVTEKGLNHGITFRDGYIYASTMNTVYRWPYDLASRTPITAAPEVVIKEINGGGEFGLR